LVWKNRTTVTSDLGTLAPGGAKRLKFDVRATKTGTYVNKATATADGGVTAEDSCKTVIRQPVLVITKTGPRNRFVGRPITYEITIANKGDGPALNTVLTDVVPSGTTFVSATGGGRLVGGKVTWNLGTLAVNASRKVSVRLTATRSGTVRNTATVTATCAEASDGASTVVKGIPAILLECVDLEDPIEVGAKETYVITVVNQGSAVGTNILVKCTLPAEQDFASATGPTKETVAGRDVTFAPLESLAPKAKATYKVTVKGTKAGDVRFKVSLKSDQMTTPAEETESTHIYE